MPSQDLGVTERHAGIEGCRSTEQDRRPRRWAGDIASGWNGSRMVVDMACSRRSGEHAPAADRRTHNEAPCLRLGR
jgi:hypothetical protein